MDTRPADLPEAIEDTLTDDMIPAELDREGWDGGTHRYRAYEHGDRRFGWAMDIDDRPAAHEAAFIQLSLRRDGDGWRVEDIDRYRSPEDAEAAAARAWADASGSDAAPPTRPVPDH